MAKKNWFLEIIIFAVLWFVGAYFFKDFGNAAGTATGFLYIGETILGSSTLNNDAGSITATIVSFIITAAVYYIVAMIITLILTKMFSKN